MLNILKAIYTHLYAGQATDPHQAVGGITAANVHRTLSLDAAGNLNVATALTAQIDDSVFTPAVSSITTIGGFADDVAPDSVDEGDMGAVRMSLNRNLYVRIRDNAGNERGLNVDANGNSGVTFVQRLDSTNDGVNTLGTLATYEAAFSVVGVASGDVVEIIGATTNIIRVLEINIIKPTVSTTFAIIKRSAAATGGASTNATLVPLDSANAAATFSIKNYTADPAEGASVGTIWTGTLATTETLVKNWVDGGGQAPTLRTTAQTICINVAAATNFSCYIRCIEQATL